MLHNIDFHKTRSQVSNLELATMTSDPQRIMQSHTNPLFLMTFLQVELKSEAVQKPELILETAFESPTEGPPFNHTTGLAPAQAVNASIFDPFITMQRVEDMQEMAFQKAKCIFA